MAIRGVIFDGDGVVFDSEHITNEGFREVLRNHGVVVTPEETLRYVGIDTLEILRIVEREHGLSIPPEVYIHEREQVYMRLCEERGAPERIAGIGELLSHLREEQVPVCIASGGSRPKIAFNLERTGLAEEFAITVSAQDVPRGKPAPDIYLEAARRIGVPISECLVIEDTIPGLMGGKAAGAMVAAIEGSHPRGELLAHTPAVYTDHHALLAALRSGEAGLLLPAVVG